MHKNAKLIVWDANLKFEYSFFKHILRKYITKIFAKSKTDILMFNVLNHLEFRECLGVFGKSLEEIAKVLKVTWGNGSQNIQSQAVLCEPDENGIRKVIFKEGLSGETKRFVFAHECAHLINGDTAPLTRPLGRNKRY